MRMNVHRTPRRRKSVNLTIDAKLLDEARARGDNLSQILDHALRQKRAEEWRAENADAIRLNNERIKREGLWSEKMRVW
jgi:antitoxin CcdA